MFFHAMRAAGLMAVSALVALAGERQVSLQGVESGQYIGNLGALPTDPIITNDFAEGIAPRLGKYTLVAREVINPVTHEISEGAFVITAANGDTVLGTYTGTVSFEPTRITWIVDGPVVSGTGRFAKATGTVHITGSSNPSAPCQGVAQLVVCGFTETTAIELALP